METSLYRASPWQQKFHNLPGGPNGIHHALGAGAAGPGKSLMLLMDPLEQIVAEHERCADPNHPHHMDWGMSVGWALHLRRVLPSLSETIQRSHRIFPRLDPKARWIEKDSTWVFASGYRFQFGHCHHTGDHTHYRSQEYTHIAFDELNEFDFEQWDNIVSRCRTTDPVLESMYKVRACANPVGDGTVVKVKDPQWVRKYFVEPCREGGKIIVKRTERRDGTMSIHRRIYLPATLYDNPDKDFVARYEDTLLANSPALREALLYGSWWITVGAFFGDVWDRDLHVCEPFPIPYDWPVFRSMDWGFKSPGTILWWAMDPDGNIFCFREHNFLEKQDVDVAAAVERIEKEEGLWKNGQSSISGPADTQLWEDRGHSAKSMAMAFAECGVGWEKAQKGPGSRQANSQLFLARLKDHHEGYTTPGIVFFDTCRQCIETIPSIMANPNNLEEPVDGGPDHWLDAVLYACAKASLGRGSIMMLEERDEWADEYERDTQDRGYDGYGSNY